MGPPRLKTGVDLFTSPLRRSPYPQEARSAMAEPQPHHDPLVRIECQWCKSQNEATALTCRACGAPLDAKDLVSDSGWREAPRLRDMTEFQFGASSCQVEGEIVPVAEINLGQGDSVFFEHHVLLWKDDSTRMSVLPMTGGVKRALAGMPFITSMAHGPRRSASSP